jgi:hypothetical protein
MREGRTVHVAPGERAVHALLAGKRFAARNLSRNLSQDGLCYRGAGGHRCGKEKSPTIHHERLHKRDRCEWMDSMRRKIASVSSKIDCQGAITPAQVWDIAAERVSDNRVRERRRSWW